jgi:DNA repair exonuclease SbcCD nuclease subunit
MKAVLFGDLHLESGTHLGHADIELGNTRIADAKRILGKISEVDADVMLFLGDVAQGPKPGPVAYAVAREAMKASPAHSTILLHGNHDHAGERYTCLDELAEGVTGDLVKVMTMPELLQLPNGLQVGCLPWAPPNRLFAEAPHDPRGISRLVAEKLIDIARGMGAKLDPDRPSILIGHWLIAGEALASGMSVMETREPLPQAQDLEASGPWDAIVFGHNHRPQQIGPKTWSCGPPMRGGFGEEDIETGFMTIEWED